jgi:anaerobic C4-dicarboxylate transporter
MVWLEIIVVRCNIFGIRLGRIGIGLCGLGLAILTLGFDLTKWLAPVDVILIIMTVVIGSIGATGRRRYGLSGSRSR